MESRIAALGCLQSLTRCVAEELGNELRIALGLLKDILRGQATLAQFLQGNGDRFGVAGNMGSAFGDRPGNLKQDSKRVGVQFP